MKKLLTLALCLSAIFALGYSFKQTKVETEPEEMQLLARKDDDSDVRVGGEDEGICLLTALMGK